MLGDAPEIVKRNSMTTWFPAVQEALEETMYPKTVFVNRPDDIDFVELLDGYDKNNDSLSWFVLEIEDAASKVGGFPCFLRNNLTSAKHEMFTPCIVRKNEDILTSVMAIAEYSEMSFWSSEGQETWSVRELLTGYPHFYSFGYKDNPGLPIGEEWRFIVRDYKVVDHFPYWPVQAFKEQTNKSSDGQVLEDREVLRALALMSQEDEDVIQSLSYWSEKICSNLEGDWSIDWMKTTKGYQCIDMADADSSWIASDEDREDWKLITEVMEG